jgi:hypothetical protein
VRCRGFFIARSFLIVASKIPWLHCFQGVFSIESHHPDRAFHEEIKFFDSKYFQEMDEIGGSKSVHGIAISSRIVKAPMDGDGVTVLTVATQAGRSPSQLNQEMEKPPFLASLIWLQWAEFHYRRRMNRVQSRWQQI